MAELQVVNLEGTEITRWDFALLKSELEQKLELYKTLYSSATFTSETMPPHPKPHHSLPSPLPFSFRLWKQF